MTDVGDHTETDDNEALEKQLLKRPTFNPVLCEYVIPKRNDLNSLKVEKDITLTLDFLSRGVIGFKELPTHLKEDILSKCESFNPVLQRAYVLSIRLYHFKYSSKRNWDSRLYNLQLPNIEKYLEDSYFVVDSVDQKSKLKQRCGELINNFTMGMYSLHEKFLTDHATNEFEFMMATYGTLRSMPLSAHYCDLHLLKNFQEKEEALRILQSSFNLVCKFAFPAACKTCGGLLDNILRNQEFEPGETHQVLLDLPLFEEEILFIRASPLPAEPKTGSKSPVTTSHTPKKVSHMHVILCYS